MARSDKTSKPTSYQVGYGKPPGNTRFKKGQSGNPRGRPKGTLNLATVLERTLREQVVINENGQRQTVTKLEAAIKQLVNKAASGDLAASRQLLTLVQIVEQQSQETAEPTTRLGDVDHRVLLGMLKRYNPKGEPDK